MKCTECESRVCRGQDISKAPDNCPMRWQKSPGEVGLAKITSDPAILNIAQNSARVEAVGYGRWTRLEETMEFAKRCGFKRLGVAFCSGLFNEATIVANIFKANGFEVFAACCKCGGVAKEEVGLTDAEKVRPGNHENMRNPIGQAHVLNEQGTDFNVVVGLCVGHDSLFLMHSKAPATVLIAKDRVLAHNPAGAIYLWNGYYAKKVMSHPYDDSKPGV